MKQNILGVSLIVTLIIFFAGFIMMGYGMTSELSYTETMQNVMGYGAVSMLIGLVGFISTLIVDNVKTI